MHISLLLLTPFIIALFPLLDLYQNNVPGIMLGEIIIFAAIISLVTTFVIAFFSVIYRSLLKGVAFTSYFFFFFFNFHHALETWNNFTQKHFGSIFFRLRYFIIILVIFFIWLFYKMLKSRSVSTLPVAFLLIFFGVMNIFAGLTIAKNLQIKLVREAVTIAHNEQHLAKLLEKSTSTPPINKPDIYYIILDMYSSHRTLSLYYNYDNTWFIDGLRQLGFHVNNNSHSNYPCTFPSLASSLNMTYISSNADLGSLIDHNVVCKFFHRNNYQVINVNSYTHVSQGIYPEACKTYGKYFKRSLKQFLCIFFTFFSYLKVKTFLLYLPQLTLFEYHRQRQVVFNQLAQLKNTTQNTSPKFVFCHILCPHPPFVFDEHGNLPKNVFHETFEKNYPQQVAFISKRILAVIKEILKNNPTKPIIILQGDHGAIRDGIFLSQKSAYEQLPINLIKQAFSHINAWHIPNGNKSLVQLSQSPVNNFRLLLNHYFKTNLRILENHSFIPTKKNDGSFKFTNIDRFLDDNNQNQTIDIEALLGIQT